MTRAAEVLDQRALNRALLARQMLLARRRIGVGAVLEQLVGLQAQVPTDPYIGLWSRVAGFAPEQLERLISGRKAVRIAVMRSTIHLVSAADCLALRPVVQSVIDRELLIGSRGRQLAGLDLAAVVRAGRAILDRAPRTPRQLGALLRERWPDRDAPALAYVLRCGAPLVQVPPRGLWTSSSQTTYATAETWLGRPLATDAAPDAMVLRYLAAFGPASARDAEAWSGLRRLGEVLERLRPRLRRFADQRGRELFDLPRAPRPSGDQPAPVRFLPSYDNALLGHADRSRIVSDDHRRRIMTAGGVAAPLLVDGFMGGTWRLSRRKQAAVLRVEALIGLSAAEVREVEGEAERLLQLLAPGARSRDVAVVRRGRRAATGAGGGAPSRR